MLSVLTLVALLQAPPGGVERLTLPRQDAEPLRYALSVPRGRTPAQPPMLVVALHPGGPRVPYYGAAFIDQVIGPALALTGQPAIMIAPDCPSAAWTDPVAEHAVLALIEHIRATFTVDDRRILVTGFSLGARGAWALSAEHADVFTGAVIAAGSPPGTAVVETLAPVPTYVIHSRADEVVPFAPAERAVRDLDRLGRNVRLEAIDGLGHYDTAKYIPAIARGTRWVLSRLGQ